MADNVGAYATGRVTRTRTPRNAKTQVAGNRTDLKGDPVFREKVEEMVHTPYGERIRRSVQG